MCKQIFSAMADLCSDLEATGALGIQSVTNLKNACIHSAEKINQTAVTDQQTSYNFQMTAFVSQLQNVIVVRNKPLREVSSQAGVSFSTLSRILNNDSTPTLETFVKLCNWMQHDPSLYFNLTPTLS